MRATSETPDDEGLTREDRYRLARELVESDAWRLLIVPHLKGLEAKFNAACRSRNLSPEKRAENIEAAHILPEIIDFPVSIVRQGLSEKPE